MHSQPIVSTGAWTDLRMALRTCINSNQCFGGFDPMPTLQSLSCFTSICAQSLLLSVSVIFLQCFVIRSLCGESLTRTKRPAGTRKQQVTIPLHHHPPPHHQPPRSLDLDQHHPHRQPDLILHPRAGLWVSTRELRECGREVVPGELATRQTHGQ